MTNVAKLRPQENAAEGTDQFRLALEAAIKEAGKARAAVARQKQAIDRTRDAVVAAEAALEKTQKGVTKAQQAHAAALANAAASGTTVPTSKVRAARQAVTDAEDELEAQKAALATLRDNLPLVEKGAIDADATVEAAISAILAPIGERLLERGRDLAAQIAPVRSALAALCSEPTDRVGMWVPPEQRPLIETKEAIAAFLRSTNGTERAQPDPWIEARRRLREDPHADLPELAALLSDV